MRNGGPKTFTATEALAAYRRVKLTTGSGTAVEYADQADDCIGVTLAAAAIGTLVAVHLSNEPGTVEVEASKALSTAGALVYGADDGKITDTASGSVKFGRILETASGSGAVVEAILDKSAT